MGEELALPAVESVGGQGHWSHRSFYGLGGITWLRIGLVVTLLTGLFWPNLRRLWLKTNPITGEANWQHSIFVPLIGLYYLYLNRDLLLAPGKTKPLDYRLLSAGLWLEVQAMILGGLFFVVAYAPLALSGRARQAVVLALLAVFAGLSLWYMVFCLSLRGKAATAIRGRVNRLGGASSNWFGMYVLLWGILFYAWSIWPGQNDFFKDFAMVVTLFGAVLVLGGWPVMRVAWFPILFMVCAIPWPQLVYSWVALPLQQLSANVAVAALRGTGVDALCEGTKIYIGGRVLNVAEACAGLRSLMTFISVAGAVAFLSARPLWQKLVICISAIPIAIACNVMRVAGQGLLDHYVSQSLSESFAHQFVGLIMLIPAFFLIILVGWILDNIFIEEMERRGLEALGHRAADNAELVIEIPRPGQRANSPAAGKSGKEAADQTVKPVAVGAEKTTAADLAAATLRLTSTRKPRGPAQTSAPAAGGNSDRGVL